MLAEKQQAIVAEELFLIRELLVVPESYLPGFCENGLILVTIGNVWHSVYASVRFICTLKSQNTPAPPAVRHFVCQKEVLMEQGWVSEKSPTARNNSTAAY